ncbi:MAG TPA: protein-glutamate O-methyltransferase CheR, partial [Terracidiphilus sp.]|nr:protein-glutamate O-methyltransferase CheR [Terracidiphilus sp.]
MSATVAADYSLLRKIVFSHSQNVLDSSSDYLFDARLAQLLRNRGLSNVTELICFLRRTPDPSLERAIAEAMTINETSFFRDGRPFELLRSALLPGIVEARRPTRTLRFWSAACSTGQEAYSIAMLLREHFSLLAGWTLRIEGTDISSEVIQKAGAGRFRRIEMNRGLPARNIVRFFDHLGDEWEVKPEIRRLCNFRQANLCMPRLPFAEPFDVIFLRNVMLYFSRETRLALL